MKNKKENISSFADGIRDFNTKGALIVPTRLTKKRAKILLSLIHEHRHEISIRYKEESSENDFCAALQWIVNEISKRWSMAELYKD